MNASNLEIIKEKGSGAFGRVFEAYHEESDKRGQLKEQLKFQRT